MKHRVILYTQKQELLNNFKKIEVLGFDYHTTSESSELFDFSSKENCMILFDIDSFDGDFREFFNYLKKEYPLIKLMVLRSSLDVLEGVELLKEGVKGYGNSFMQPVHLKQAVDVVCEGNIWIFPELAVYMIQQTPVNSSKVDALSDMDSREKEIINFVSKGMRNKEIAQMLTLSEISVKKALTVIYHKLHVKDRVEMIALFNR